MVYRPRPARVVTLNTASWLLFEACNGGTVAEIEAAILRVQAGTPRALAAKEVLAGLQQLLDLALVEPCPEQPGISNEGATT
ncbi:PqqD family protein [Ramlibacter sp. AN1133]|uniref:PqqD family protein n=1 Tax=Ramlibacter sp. AN1133 TaxID=3133429 RepID=UPI0030BF88BF